MKRFLCAGESYVSPKPKDNPHIVSAIARQSGLTTWAIAVLLALIGLFTQVAQADVTAPAEPTSRAVVSTETVHKPSSPFQQQNVLTGTVVDQDGQPIEGATIAVRGTAFSTSTDSRGQFTLSTATSNGTLLISLLGHQSITQRFDAENPGPFHFTLIPVDSRLEEVEVSTGYQRLPRERATGSFVFIDSALLNRSVSTDIISRLKGVTPSLLFDERAGGEPKLSIRGRSTIFANADPLIVVDNFPYEGNINNINPNDVESVTILRDAAAASIWGVRAGNGVIVITTKQGKAGHPLQVSFNGNVTVGAKPDLWYEPRISSADLVELEEFLYENGHFQDALVNSVSHPPISPAVEVMSNPTLSQDEKQNLLAKLKKNDVRHDLNRYFYQPTVNQQYASNLSGSSPRHQYFLFAGHDRNRRETVGNHYERSSISARQGFQLKSNLTIHNNISYTMGRNQYNHILNDLKNIGSYVRLVDDEGNHLPVARVHSLSFAASAEDRGLLDWLYVPLDELEHVDHTNLLTHLRMQQSIDLEWFKGFGTRAFYQYENQSTYGENLRNQYSFAARDLINRFSDLRSETVVRNVPLGGNLLKSTQRTAVHNGRIEGYYSKLHGSHNFQLIGGLEIRQAITSGGNQVIYGYDPMTGIGKAVNQDSLYVLFPAGNRGTISGFNGVSQMIDRFRSYYFNGAYTLNQLYVFSASARIDQSNLFGVRANQRSVPLWSAGFKWNISQEHAYRLEWLPTLQLRATYGYNGNMDNSLTAYATMRYFDDGTGLNIARVENTPNPHLRWEKTALLNVGMDFRLAEGFVSGSLDYYHKRGMDLIGYGPLESTTGRTVFRGNVAGMRGEGLDVEFHFLPFPAGQIRWTGTLLASFISDKVTEYRADPPTISAYFGDASLPGSDYTPQKGMPLFSVYSYPWAGLDPQTGAPRGYLDGVASTDYNEISRVATFNSLVYHGRAVPSWYGSIRNEITYRHLSLSVSIGYKLGYYFRRSSIRYDFLFANGTGHGDYHARWQRPGDEEFTSIPARTYPVIPGSDNFYNYSSQLIEKGDHIRLQDFQFTYAYRKCRFYVYGDALPILWRANRHGIDPDIASGVIPKRYHMSIGLTVDF